MSLFKAFSPEESIRSQTQIKTSVKRSIRKQLVELYPAIEVDVDLLLHKELPVHIAKCEEYVNLLISLDTPWFFQIRDGPWVPTLRTLHRYPEILPKLQVDRGAIPFVLKGANIMCRGLTTPGGNCDADVAEGQYVAVMLEGKKHAASIGLTKMSTADIKKINKDVAVDNIHFLNDGLWGVEELSN